MQVVLMGCVVIVVEYCTEMLSGDGFDGQVKMWLFEVIQRYKLFCIPEYSIQIKGLPQAMISRLFNECSGAGYYLRRSEWRLGENIIETRL